MWAIMAAPLITGNDLSTMSAADEGDSHEQGRSSPSIRTHSASWDAWWPGTERSQEVWSKEMSGTTRGSGAVQPRHGQREHHGAMERARDSTGAATVRDLWAATDRGSFTGSYTANSVPSHSVVMLKVDQHALTPCLAR
jgi:hypothetical protein